LSEAVRACPFARLSGVTVCLPSAFPTPYFARFAALPRLRPRPGPPPLVRASGLDPALAARSRLRPSPDRRFCPHSPQVWKKSAREMSIPAKND